MTGAAAEVAAPTSTLPGIGPALAAALAERDITTVADLAMLVPRRYDDARAVRPLAEVLAAAPDGERLTFRGQVTSARMVFVRRRRWAEVRISDGDAALLVRWFNAYGGQASIDKRFPVGSEVALSGPLKRRAGRAEMANPDVLGVGEVGEGAGRIMPRYPDVPGVPPAKLRAACRAAAERVGRLLDDGVPASVIDRAGLVGLGDALAMLHAPPDHLSLEDVAALDAGTSVWHRRLAWGELFVLGAAIARRRRLRRADAAVPCPALPIDRVTAALPFALTGAQRRAIDEIGGDLARPTPMNRLLQGDVGAGKTAVAFAAMRQVAAAGRQAALMVPTEILAEQHHATLAVWAARAGLRLVLLTASTPRLERAAIVAGLADGTIDAVVGTQALLSEGVGFARLGLVVVDEQHRFGVAQRVQLRGKGGAPHLLVMTATPIPRTLALTAYGDLDVTLLDELPPGRAPVRTRAVSGARGRAQAYQRVRAQVAAGRRAFVVCPRVAPGAPTDDDDDDPAVDGADWRDVTSVAAELAETLAPARVGLVHGQLASDARDAVMAAFQRGDLDVLVATTVIEVGVDVPAASIVVVEDADIFGLAQLHQLRGRVGRGGGDAECLLVTRGALTDEARRRLAVMVETTDGFRIAEEDLALRGPGELLGARQAGLPRLRFGDLRTQTELLLEARREAEAVIEVDPSLERPEHRGLRAALERRLGAQAFGSEGG